MPRDVSLSDSECWNGGHEWVKQSKSKIDKPEHLGAIAKVRTYAGATSNISSASLLISLIGREFFEKNANSSTVDNEEKIFELKFLQ